MKYHLLRLKIIIISLLQHKGADDEKGIEIKKATFKTGSVFNNGCCKNTNCRSK